MTGILTPGKLLNGILILNGSPPEDTDPNRDFFDDFVVDAATEATFNVTKDFSDDNPAQVSGEAGPAVAFEASCDAGTLAVINGSAAPGAPAEFELSDFPWDGAACSVTEPVPPAGYSQAASTCEGLTIVPSDSATNCEITNAETRATFWVTKTYSDGNDDQVEVTLSCNNGLPLEQSFLISDGNPVNFVITNFTEGEVDCEVTETGTADGYTPSYDNGSVVSDLSCAYADVASGEFSCAITNNADPATFTVYKEWVIAGAVGHEVLEEARVTIYCNNEIQGGGSNGSYYYLSDILVGDGDSLTATVDTTLQSAQCWAEEDLFESGVESENDCGSRSIAAGGSSSCTITNTVFFEGIPTLNQYGLALLALLMLGVGLVGLRRFV